MAASAKGSALLPEAKNVAAAVGDPRAVAAAPAKWATARGDRRWAWTAMKSS